jgi:putative ABC transport system permease protein
MDKGFFQIPLEDATEFLRTGGAVQQILIFLKDYTRAGKVSAQIKQSLAKAGIPIAVSGSDADGELSIQSWTEIGEYPRLILMMEGIYFWIELVITFLGAFIISNIMMMVVLERKREIGIMKALGLNRRETLWLFLTEGALMGSIGSGVGAVFGFLLCWVFSVYGIDFSSAVGSLTFPIDPVFYSVVNPLGIVGMFCIGLFVSMVVSYLPSRRAARLDPVEAIKAVA